MSAWTKVRTLYGSEGTVAKYVFEQEGARPAVAEAVLYRYPDFRTRTVVCCSVQSGCQMGCRFCGSGDNFVRSLTAGEIVAQPVRAIDDTGVDPAEIRKLQIMFMSMGEPMHNFRNVAGAIRRLHALYPNADLLLSTAAPKVNYGPLRRLSQEIQKLGLQFSVHESTDERRNALIPNAHKLSLRDLAIEGIAWHGATGRHPFFNYCAHPGNTSPEDADRLRELFDPRIWQATISVICERDEHVAAAHERQREQTAAFSALLLERGFSVRVFNPAGQDDIGGGCGQLWFVQDWMGRHPDRARPSRGKDLDPDRPMPGLGGGR